MHTVGGMQNGAATKKKPLQSFLKTPNVGLPHTSATPLLGKDAKKLNSGSRRYICAPMVNACNQSRVHLRVNGLSHTGESYSATLQHGWALRTCCSAKEEKRGSLAAWAARG